MDKSNIETAAKFLPDKLDTNSSIHRHQGAELTKIYKLV
jgi:hypothetical protein